MSMTCAWTPTMTRAIEGMVNWSRDDEQQVEGQ